MGKKPGTKNFTRAQIMAILDLVEKHQPVGQDQWDTVSFKYGKICEKEGWEEKDGESLKAKFRGLVTTKKPTGEASIPTPIKRAKAINRDILNNVKAVNLESGNLSLSESSDNEEVVVEDALPPTPPDLHTSLTDVFLSCTIFCFLIK
jgi:hypothetical protein